MTETNSGPKGAGSDPLVEAIRQVGPELFSLAVQAEVDRILAKDVPPLTVGRRRRLIKAAERPLRVRREILRLAGFATGHRPRRGSICSACFQGWPCTPVMDAARSALDAFAACDSEASRKDRSR